MRPLVMELTVGISIFARHRIFEKGFSNKHWIIFFRFGNI